MSTLPDASSATSPPAVVQPPTTRPPLDRENPWPGLAYFEKEDSDFFHGRESEQKSLIDLVAHENLVLLYGPSGLGKTSLLRAGVLPALPPTVLPVYLRLEFRHDADLTLQVIEAVERAAGDCHLDVPPRPPTGTLWEYFRRRDQSCAFWGPDDQLVLPLLVFDQFEQLFTRDQRAMPTSVVNEFLTDLGDLVHGRIPWWLSERAASGGSSGEKYFFDSTGCKTLLSFREDFLADAARLTMLVPAIDRNALRLEPMRWSDAVKAVRLSGVAILAPVPEALPVPVPEALPVPAIDLSALPFEPMNRSDVITTVRLSREGIRAPLAGQVERGGANDVAAAIVDIVAGSDRLHQATDSVVVEPAILSVFCSELNERRKTRVLEGGPRLIDLELVGTQGASEIIARFYARAVEHVPATIRTLIETRLVIPPTPTAPTGVRTSVAYEELSDLQRDAIAPLVNEWRILRLEPVGRQRQLRVELTHDVLVKPVLEERRRSDDRAKAAAEAAEREREVKERIERERQERLVLQAQLAQQRQEQAQTRRWLTAVVVIAAVAFVAGVAALVAWRRAVRESARAERESAVSRRLAVGPDILQITELARRGRQPEALAKAAALMDADPDNDSVRNLTANLLFHNSWWLPTTPSTKLVSGIGCASALSPDGSRGITSCSFGEIVLWNAGTGALVARLVHQGGVSASFSPDGRLVLTGSNDGIAVWNAVSGRQERLLPLRTMGGRPAAEFSRDGTRLVTLSDYTQPTIWSTETWLPIRTLQHPTPVSSAHFTADSQAVVTATVSGGVRIWSLAPGRTAPSVVNTPECKDALPSPSGRRLVCVRQETLIPFTLTDRGTFERMNSLMPGQTAGSVQSVQWGEDDVLLSVQEGVATLWTLDRSGAPIRFDLPLAGVLDAAFDPGGRYVVAGASSDDGPVVQVWDTRSSRVVSSVVAHDGFAVGRLSRDARHLVTTASEGEVRVWRAVTESAPAADSRVGYARRVQFASSGKWLLVEGTPGLGEAISVRDVATGQETATSPPEVGEADTVATFAALDADRVLVVTGSRAIAYDVKARGTLETVRTTSVPCPSTSPLNPSLSAMSRRGVIAALVCGEVPPKPDAIETPPSMPVPTYAWDISTGGLVAGAQTASRGPVVSIEISPDGSRMVVTRTDEVKIIDTATGSLVAEPISQTTRADQSLSFSSALFTVDGRELIVTTQAGDIQRRPVHGGNARPLAVRTTPNWIWFTDDPRQLGTTTAIPPTVRLWSTDDDARKPLLAPSTIIDFSVSRRDLPDGLEQRAVTLSGNDVFTVSGVRTLYPETGEIFEAGARRAQLSPDGSRVAVIGRSGVALIETPRTARSDVAWLKEAVGAVTGFDVRSYDMLLHRGNWLDTLSAYAARAGRTSAPGSLQEKIEQWLFGAPSAQGK